MAKKELAIIIVTYESESVIKYCLEDINFDKYEVYVVDNNSQDSTTSIVEKEFPLVNLVKLEKNIGFGRANNIALRKTKADYSLILNPDAFMKDHDLQQSINILKDNQKVALASPVTYKADRIDDYERERKELNKIKGDKIITKCDFVVGGVMFMNMNIFRKIGFFDENIFMFSEDNEICARALENGYGIIKINNAVAFHKGAGSSTKTYRTIYRRFWHLGWSKSYWKSRRKGWLSVKKSTFRLVIQYILESIFNLLKFNLEKVVSKFAFSMGCFAHLIGFKAFDRNDNARG